MVADWGNMPIELATKIVEHVEFYEDFETFRFVSSVWRSAAKQAKFCGKVSLPRLMLPEDNPSSGRRRLYSLHNHRFRNVDLPLPSHLNGSEDMRLLSSRGWLLSVSKRCKNITLLNPLSGAIIQLPVVRFYNRFHQGEVLKSFSYYRTSMFEKFILSANPSTTSDFSIAMILHEPYANLCCWHNIIVFWSNNSEDNQWVPLSERKSVSYTMTLDVLDRCHDICFYQGKVYGADSYCNVLRFDLSHDIPQVRIVSNLYERGYIPSRYGEYYDSDGVFLGKTLYYMVESAGKLLHVTRVKTLREGYYSTTLFRVFELNVDDGTAKEMLDLGTRAIFVGSSSSFSVDAYGYGCKPNSIYYTDEVRSFYYEFGSKGKDIGIYDLTKGEIECLDKGITPHYKLTPLMWVESPRPLTALIGSIVASLFLNSFYCIIVS